MTSLKLLRNQIILIGTISLTVISPIVYSFLPLQAQIAKSSDNPLENLRMEFVPPEPEDNGTTGERKGAGTHGPCQIADSKPLIALVPEYTVKDRTYVHGRTTVGNPTFWLYIPYSSKTYVELVLYNQEEDLVYETSTPLMVEGTPAVISFTLPSEFSLELGKQYNWFFYIYCDRLQDSPDNTVEGWVQRVSLSSELLRQVEEVTPLERIALLAKNGIWYDPLTALGQLRQENPDDETIADAWQDLLESVELEEISQEPIVP